MHRPSAWCLVATALLLHSAGVPAAALQGIQGDLRLQPPSIAQQTRPKARQLLQDEALSSPPPPPPPPPPPSDSIETPEVSPSPSGLPLLSPQPAADPPADAPPEESLVVQRPAAASPLPPQLLPPPAASPATSSIADLVLRLHNDARAQHQNTPPLSWSAELQAGALTWAQRCQFQHSGLPGFGENLYEAANFPASTAPGLEAGWQQAMVAWYDDEAPHYSYAAPSYGDDVGHFTQIVWASTTAVGCARVYGCAAGAGLGAGWVQALYVCRYSPPGNVQSVQEYTANVHPLAALQADSSG